ncbi:MAG: DUF3040 domain-containing protein [Actinomycetota bacterium]|nr:DUF3040 domain-containing protein [Actinomycetota bacterium]
MDRSKDRVTLTIEERRSLAALEDRADRDDPKLKVALTLGLDGARVHLRRVHDPEAVLCFVVGVVVMVATFVRWPAGAVVGLVLQMLGLWVLITRWGPVAAEGIRRRIGARHNDVA